VGTSTCYNPIGFYGLLLGKHYFLVKRIDYIYRLETVRRTFCPCCNNLASHSTILSVVLCGCETWSLTLRAEHRLRVFENRVLRRIFGPKRDEVTGEWRKLHNEEFRDLYSSPSIIRIIKSRRMRWAEHVARIWEKMNAYRLLVGKSEGKRPLGRPRCRWVDNIRMDLGEVGWGDVDWISLAQDRNWWRALVNSVLNLSSGLTSSGVSSSAQLHRVS
jgi:hypothetical protein